MTPFATEPGQVQMVCRCGQTAAYPAEVVRHYQIGCPRAECTWWNRGHRMVPVYRVTARDEVFSLEGYGIV